MHEYHTTSCTTRTVAMMGDGALLWELNMLETLEKMDARLVKIAKKFKQPEKVEKDAKTDNMRSMESFNISFTAAQEAAQNVANCAEDAVKASDAYKLGHNDFPVCMTEFTDAEMQVHFDKIEKLGKTEYDCEKLYQQSVQLCEDAIVLAEDAALRAIADSPADARASWYATWLASEDAC
jgi:hypothetical protein